MRAHVQCRGAQAGSTITNMSAAGDIRVGPFRPETRLRRRAPDRRRNAIVDSACGVVCAHMCCVAARKRDRPSQTCARRETSASDVNLSRSARNSTPTPRSSSISGCNGGVQCVARRSYLPAPSQLLLLLPNVQGAIEHNRTSQPLTGSKTHRHQLEACGNGRTLDTRSINLAES